METSQLRAANVSRDYRETIKQHQVRLSQARRDDALPVSKRQSRAHRVRRTSSQRPGYDEKRPTSNIQAMVKTPLSRSTMAAPTTYAGEISAEGMIHGACSKASRTGRREIY